MFQAILSFGARPLNGSSWVYLAIIDADSIAFFRLSLLRSTLVAWPLFFPKYTLTSKLVPMWYCNVSTLANLTAVETPELLPIENSKSVALFCLIKSMTRCVVCSKGFIMKNYTE